MLNFLLLLLLPLSTFRSDFIQSRTVKDCSKRHVVVSLYFHSEISWFFPQLPNIPFQCTLAFPRRLPASMECSKSTRVAVDVQLIAFHHARRVRFYYVRAIKCCLFAINIRSFSNFFRMIPTAPFNHLPSTTPKSVLILQSLSVATTTINLIVIFNPFSVHCSENLSIPARKCTFGWKIATRSGGRNFK